jgi:hypothetical protein
MWRGGGFEKGHAGGLGGEVCWKLPWGVFGWRAGVMGQSIGEAAEAAMRVNMEGDQGKVCLVQIGCGCVLSALKRVALQ